jgi:RNA polymerase sigma-70 factor (ECF subfamily)
MVEQLGDNRLMERVKTGDSTAFELLFKKYQHRLLNFFHKLCFSQTLSEDLTQETFFRLWRSRHAFTPDAGKFTTYLFQIAKNRWFSHSQTKKYRAEEAAAGLGAVSTSASADPGLNVESADLQHKLREAINSLPDDLRIPFVLSRYEGLRYEDIAQVLEISSRTVERRVSDAARLLAKRLLGK